MNFISKELKYGAHNYKPLDVVLKKGSEFFKKGELQFGGFPNATRINEF